MASGCVVNSTTSRATRKRRVAPWQVADAPEPFIVAQMKGIVGLEIPILRIEGKWKVSQNRPAADQAGVVAGLRGSGPQADAIAAALVERAKKP